MALVSAFMSGTSTIEVSSMTRRSHLSGFSSVREKSRNANSGAALTRPSLARAIEQEPRFARRSRHPGQVTPAILPGEHKCCLERSRRVVAPRTAGPRLAPSLRLSVQLKREPRRGALRAVPALPAATVVPAPGLRMVPATLAVSPQPGGLPPQPRTPGRARSDARY